MSTVRALRVLILIELAAGVLSMVTDAFTASFMPLELQAYRASEETREWEMFDWVLAIAWLIVLVATLCSLVGLWRMKAWGRTLYTYSTIAIFILLPFGTPMVNHQLVYALDALGGT